jgi:integrase
MRRDTQLIPTLVGPTLDNADYRAFRSASAHKVRMSISPIADLTDSAEIERRDTHAKRIQAAMDASLSTATRRAYAGAIRQLQSWCEAEHFEDWLAPLAIAAHITARVESGRGVSTVTICLAAIRQYAIEHDLPSDPTRNSALRRTVAGVRHQLVGRTPSRAHALTTRELARILSAIDRSTKAGKRDAALLTLIYASAMRRSEVAALRRRDLRLGSDGIVVTISKSKTDQFGGGEVVGVTKGLHPGTDPLSAVTRWLAARGHISPEQAIFCRITRSGAILAGSQITGATVAKILQTRAAAAGVEAIGLSGHSPRSGHITTAAIAGLSLEQIARTSRHKSIPVLMTYIRPATVLGDTSAGSLGL